MSSSWSRSTLTLSRGTGGGVRKAQGHCEGDGSWPQEGNQAEAAHDPNGHAQLLLNTGKFGVLLVRNRLNLHRSYWYCLGCWCAMLAHGQGAGGRTRINLKPGRWWWWAHDRIIGADSSVLAGVYVGCRLVFRFIMGRAFQCWGRLFIDCLL